MTGAGTLSPVDVLPHTTKRSVSLGRIVARSGLITSDVMVEVTDAPPEKLYRPDESLLKWRKLAEDVTEERLERLAEHGLGPAGGQDE